MANGCGAQLSISRIKAKVCAGGFVLVSAYYTLAIPNLPVDWLHPALALHTGSFALIIICAVLCTIANVPRSSEDKTRYCERCKKLVGFESVHCEDCRMCIDGFRLHSGWLDNCIGSRNARSYAGLLVSVSITCGMEMAAEGWVATVVMVGEKEGQAIAQVSPTQAYSLLDNGYLFKLTLLCTAAVSLVLCLGSITHFFRYYVRKHFQQPQMTRVSDVSASAVGIRATEKSAYSGMTKISLFPTRINASGTEILQESSDFTRDEVGTRNKT